MVMTECGDNLLTTIADIVERLRDTRYMHPPRSMLEEAADEIKRLRDKCEGLEAEVEFRTQRED
jgi:ubiquinone biosynthesis protein UbiJ